MGLYPSAHIIYGVVLESYDPDGDTKPWYRDDGEGYSDWWLPADLLVEGLVIEPVGHYEDPDPIAILALKDIYSLDADAWKPKAILVSDLRDFAGFYDKRFTKARDAVRAYGWGDLFDEPEWLLVAGYG